MKRVDPAGDRLREPEEGRDRCLELAIPATWVRVEMALCRGGGRRQPALRKDTPGRQHKTWKCQHASPNTPASIRQSRDGGGAALRCFTVLRCRRRAARRL
jgi:hypothetical protein